MARFARKWGNGFFASVASFSGPAFSDSAFLSIALMASAQDQPAHSWRPSEDHFHGGGLGLPLFHEGRRTEDAMQSRKKKTMKTTSQKNNSGAREQIRNIEQTNTNTEAAPVAQPAGPSGTDRKDNRLPIDSEARKANRTLPTPKVLNLLLTTLPDVYRAAEVVGKWVWVQFKEQPAAEIRQQLAQLGFHWNRERQAWQHPCGQFRLSSNNDPHEKYSSYRPASIRRSTKAQTPEAVAA